MKILFLAPHPFYQERGTPIAVDLLLRSLSAAGHEVDLITFNEGSDREHSGVTTYRIRPFGNIVGITPGFSLKKLYLDIFVFFRFLSLFFRKQYDVVHAVEESVYMAALICPLKRTPYIYDMDSSMVTQLVDRHQNLGMIEGLLRFIESIPARFADIVVPCCDALVEDIDRYRDRDRKPVFVLKDISLLDKHATAPSSGVDIRGLVSADRAKNGERQKVVMYIGNLESYQGIDLMLEGFAAACNVSAALNLVIVGGEQQHIGQYRAKAEHLGVSSRVFFLGKQPVSDLYALMLQSDLLLSPRIQGVNTPMKVYSYLDSGVPVVATRLPTHTQVMTDDIARLVDATSEGIRDGIVGLIDNPAEYENLAKNALDFIRENHSFESFDRRVNEIYAAL